MTKLEKHVPSLEMCKRLKELGFPQNSNLCYWMQNLTDGMWDLVEGPQRFSNSITLAAPIATELLEWLPAYNSLRALTITKKDNKSFKSDRGFEIAYQNSNSIQRPIMKDDNLSEALAKLLIYLVENKIVSFEKEEINE